MKQGMKLGMQELKNVILGGTILGSGGGGDPKKGTKYAEIAVKYSDLYLRDINDFDDDGILITASLVGAPKAPNQYMTGANLVRAVELFQERSGVKIAGIITNENGGEASVNGWLQASVLGIPLIDAPCNGRAHPTGVMGSLSLHTMPDYVTTQACVGGDPSAGRYVECVFSGSVDATSKLVRMSSVEAGGLVGVARNPVTVAHAKKHAAVGGLTHAVKTGEAFYKGLETSPERAVEEVMQFLGGQIVARGAVSDFTLKTEGGFDVGYGRVDDVELTFWNEYMTLDRAGERIATFPDFIMTFDAKTGEPLPTSRVEPGMEIYVCTTKAKNLKLSSTMRDKGLLAQCEGIVGRELVKYLEL